VVSGLITLFGFTGYAVTFAGFIPALASGATVAGDPGYMLPWWLTPLSATLVHAGFGHLLLNMVVLFYCGRQLEHALGSRAIWILYLVGAYVAAAGQWVLDPGSPVPLIGASGAISAIIAAYAALFGETRAKAFGPIPARVLHVLWLAAAWIGVQLLFALAGLGGEIALGAHVGGFLIGLVLTRPLLLWRYRGA
jgi:membrane associated rhomboid family serine protease